MSPRALRNLLLIGSAALVLGMAATAAYAAPACYPRDIGGTGTAAVERNNEHGSVLVWRCNGRLVWVGARVGDDLPTLKGPRDQARAQIDAADAMVGHDRTGMAELRPLVK
jgi:hypothetical protein